MLIPKRAGRGEGCLGTHQAGTSENDTHMLDVSRGDDGRVGACPYVQIPTAPCLLPHCNKKKGLHLLWHTRLLLNVWITGREQISAAAACVRRFAESLAPCIHVRPASRICYSNHVRVRGCVTLSGRALCHAFRFSKDRETTLQIKGVATWTGPNQLMAAL